MRYARGLAVTAAAFLAVGITPAARAGSVSPAAVTRLWTVTNPVTNHNASGQAAVVSPDGTTLFVTGSDPLASNPADGYGQTVAYSTSTGAQIWKATLDPGTQYSDGFSSIAVSPDGSTVIVTGFSGKVGSTTGVLQVIVAYSASTGAVLWQVSGPADTGSSPVAISPDSSTVYVTSAGTGQTAAYSTAAGTQIWTDPAGGDALALSAAGGTLAIAGSNSAGDGLAETFDASTGATISTATYAHPANFTTIALNSDASTVFAAGLSQRTFVTAAYTVATGAKLWLDTADASGTQSTVDGLALASTWSPLVETRTATALTSGVDESHWKTLGINPATGAQLWSEGYSDVAGEQEGGAKVSALGISPDGTTAYVTGYVTDAAGNDYWVTAAYRTSNGNRRWKANYNGRTENVDYALAVSPDGTDVFVTGNSAYTGTGETDVMATVGYTTPAPPSS
jgi:hypothetical protein